MKMPARTRTAKPPITAPAMRPGEGPLESGGVSGCEVLVDDVDVGAVLDAVFATTSGRKVVTDAGMDLISVALLPSRVGVATGTGMDCICDALLPVRVVVGTG
jgi:hypothetical protein